MASTMNSIAIQDVNQEEVTNKESMITMKVLCNIPGERDSCICHSLGDNIKVGNSEHNYLLSMMVYMYRVSPLQLSN